MMAAMMNVSSPSSDTRIVERVNRRSAETLRGLAAAADVADGAAETVLLRVEGLRRETARSRAREEREIVSGEASSRTSS